MRAHPVPPAPHPRGQLLAGAKSELAALPEPPSLIDLRKRVLAIDLEKIKRHWSDILRVVVSIYTGEIRAYDVMRMI